MLRVILAVVCAVAGSDGAGQDEAEPGAVPAPLVPFEHLIGQWRAHGFTEADRLRGWDEQPQWGWRFKNGQIVAMEATFQHGKYFTAATLEHVTANKYRLDAINPDQKPVVYSGTLAGKKLVLARETKGVTAPDQVTIELLHDVRYQMLIEARKTAKSVRKIATIGATRSDVRFGAAGKEELGPKCIITGAPGTSAVSHNGQTYYVCCSGCRSEFEHDPEKWLKLARQAKGKNQPAGSGNK